MNDPRFRSVHLVAVPRREAYRRAREQLENACGDFTIAGSIQLADLNPPLDAPTQHPDARGVAREAIESGTLVCYLQDQHRIIVLRVGLNSVGRLPDNDVVINDASVSRRHCAILVHSDLTCEIHDTASKNGTILNGLRINGPTRLRHGDEITLCDYKMKFGRAAELPSVVPAPTKLPQPGPSFDRTLPG